MYHYTYLIQHNTADKRYIGVRSCKCLPIEDTEYWGSSKHLPNDIKSTHTKIILKHHKTRKEALNHEISLHWLNDVACNPSYYNKAKQTSIGFDTTGTTLSPEHKKACSEKLKNRVFTSLHKKRISDSTIGKPKSEIHRKNCSIAQKKLASAKDYKNPRKGVVVSKDTKAKISKTIKDRGINASINNNRFKPWFISQNNVTTLYFDKTKEEVAKEHGCTTLSTYQNLSTKSKGYLPVKRGTYKGSVIGNIEDARKNMSNPTKPKQKRAWYITYPQKYSILFYYTTRKEYAEQYNIKPQAVNDAIHLSNGKHIMKKGHFKGLILGRIT